MTDKIVEKSQYQQETLISILAALEKLSLEELRQLYQHIGQMLHKLHGAQARLKLMDFTVGDQVLFHHNNEVITGIIIRLNRTTATIHTSDHRHWRVSPAWLRKIVKG